MKETTMKLRRKLALSLTLGLGMVVALGTTSFLVASCSRTNSSTSPTPRPENDKFPPNSTTPPHGGESLNPAPTPSVPPQNGETSKPTPTPSQPAPQKPQAPTEPVEMMTFSVDMRRTSGFQFNSTTIPGVNVVDIATNKNMFNTPRDDYDDSRVDGFITMELPKNATYKVTLNNFSLKTYNYKKEIILDKDHPHGSFEFDPVIEPAPKTGFYDKNDVSHELPFKHDVLNRPVSLQKNRENGKMSIIMYMRTTCYHSKRTLNSIYSAINWLDDGTPTPENWDKIELYCVSDDDTVQQLQDFIKKEGFNQPWMHFIADPSNQIRNAYFPNTTGYPKLAFVDYQGVFINKVENELTKRDTIRNFMNNYSRQGGYY